METLKKERLNIPPQEQVDETVSPVSPEEMAAELKAAQEAIREMDEASQRAKEQIAQVEAVQGKVDEGRIAEVREALNREGADRSKAESGVENGPETQTSARREKPDTTETLRGIAGERIMVSAAEKAKDGASHEVSSKFGICPKCEGSGTRFLFFTCSLCKGSGRVETARQEKRAMNTERASAASASREVIK